MKIKEIQNEIVDEFSFFEDWEQRYEYLIELGKSLNTLPEEAKTDDKIIKGCQSSVWLDAELDGDTIEFKADSNAILPKGIAALLVRMYNHQTPKDILESDTDFINEIGFDTYQKIMNEAIDELKENEFKDLYQEENDIETKEFVKDIQIDTDFELLFPDEYINNITERLNLYNELSQIKDEATLQQYEQKLIDRFGALPKPAIALLNSVRIKWKATAMGIERLMMKQGKMIGYFIGDQQSDFYQSNRFMKVLQFAQRNGNVCKIKEKETKNGLRLLLTFDNVKSVNKALELLEGI
jgi:sulfur transfer protein SufE